MKLTLTIVVLAYGVLLEGVRATVRLAREQMNALGLVG
jgi:hypothetical protein